MAEVIRDGQFMSTTKIEPTDLVVKADPRDIFHRGGGGGGSAPPPKPKDDGAEQRAEQKRQEDLRKDIEKERSRRHFELREGYREDLRDIKGVQERQERLQQLREDMARVNIESQQRKLDEGLITGYTVVTGGYAEGGKYIPRKKIKIREKTQPIVEPQREQRKYLGFIESTSPVGKLITGTKERFDVIKEKFVKKEEKELKMTVDEFRSIGRKPFEEKIQKSLIPKKFEKDTKVIKTETRIEPVTTKSRIESLYWGVKSKVRSLFLKPEETMEEVGGVRGVIGRSSLRVKEGLTYIGGKPGEAIGDLYPSTTETKTIEGEFEIPTRSTIIEGEFNPFRFDYQYETTSTAQKIKTAGQIGAGVVWYSQPTPLLIAQESSILTAPSRTGITTQQRIEAGIGLGFGVWRGARYVRRNIPRKKLMGMSIERYEQYQRNLAKSKEMLALAEQQKTRVIKQKLTALEGLDKGAARLKSLGLDIKATSAYQEAIKPTAWGYMGTGAQRLGKKQLTQFADDLVNQGVYKTREEALKAIRDSGVYKMPFETQRVTNLKSFGISESGKPVLIENINLKKLPVGYEDFGKIKTSVYGLEAVEKTKGVTRVIGFQWQEGARGSIINKRVITGVGKKDLMRFSIYEPGRISYKYVPTKAGPIKITTYPYTRKVEEQLVKTKMLGAKKQGPYIFREYTPEYRLVYGKTKRLSPLGFMDDLSRTPPTKKEWKQAFKTDKEFVEDVIIKGKPELKFDIAGKAKVTKEGMKGVIGAQVYTEKPYKQFATGISDKGIIRVSKAPTDIGYKQFLGGGKKSSQKYLQSLYQKTEPVIIPKPSPKVRVPRVKLTPPPPSLTSQELAPRMVGGLGLGVSKSPAEETTIIKDIPPVIIERDFLSSKVDTGLDTGVKTKIDTGLKLKPFSTERLETETKTSELLKQPVKVQTKLGEAVKQKEEQRLIQPLKTMLKQRQVQKQALKLKQALQLKTKTKTKPRIDIGGGGFDSGLGKALTKVKELKPSEFEVFVKKFGKDVSIGLYPTKREARKELLGKLKTTIRAGGFIEEKGKKIPFTQLGIKSPEFRPGKKDIFRVIQRKEKRLGMKGETEEIQFFRKTKGNKGGKKKNLFGI